MTPSSQSQTSSDIAIRERASNFTCCLIFEDRKINCKSLEYCSGECARSYSNTALTEERISNP